jgi:hypothetical protein
MCQWQTLRQNLPTWLTPWRNRYEGHPQAVILACYFNPQNSPYRLQAFQRFYLGGVFLGIEQMTLGVVAQ